MRFVLLTTSYPRAPGDPSGHFIETEALELAQQGHEVHVIAPGTATRESDGVRVWGAGGGSLFGLPGALARARENPLRVLELVRFVPRVRRRLRELGPVDRVVAHFVVPCGYPLSLTADGELEVVLHGSDVSLVVSLPALARAHVVRRLLARDARFRFVSESLRARLLGRLTATDREAVELRSRVEPAKISVPRPTETEVARCRSLLGREDRPKWVACGRLVASKRVDRAIHEATRRGAELTIIGDGPMRGALEALALRTPSPARFLGTLPRHQALAFIASADRLIHTSESEGAPTVIREARALGVPVIATPSGDIARWAADDPGIELLPIA